MHSVETVVWGVPWWLNALRILHRHVAQVIAVARVWSLAQELPHDICMAEKKKKGGRERKEKKVLGVLTKQKT